jgi:AhpD family alkylhydroperoxidase
MHNRIEWAKHAPKPTKPWSAWSRPWPRGAWSSLLELIRLRASQINGCAYCVNLHANDARKAGETEARLQTLCVWRETATSPRVNVRRWPGSRA